MLRSVKSLEGFSIGATDGTIGKVKDFYFDDEAWVIRYAVVNTTAWLGREVLLSPYSIGQADWDGKSTPCHDYQRTGQEQSGHRHRQTHIATVRDVATWVTTVILIIGAEPGSGVSAIIPARC